MERNQRKYVLAVVAFVIASGLLALGVRVYDSHLRRLAEDGPAAVTGVHVVHRPDGTAALLTVSPIAVRQHWGRGAPPVVLHRLDVVDAESGERLLRRTWDDDTWPRCRDAGPGRLRCESPAQPWHFRSLATLDALDEAAPTPPDEPPRHSTCTAQRASRSGLTFQTRRAETSIRELIEVGDARGLERTTCAEPELIAPEIVCDDVTGEALDIGVKKAVLVDHRNTLLNDAATRHGLTAIDSECHLLWQRELDAAGDIRFASLVGQVLVVLLSRSSHGTTESHLLGIDPATGNARWQL